MSIAGRYAAPADFVEAGEVVGNKSEFVENIFFFFGIFPAKFCRIKTFKFIRTHVVGIREATGTDAVTRGKANAAAWESVACFGVEFRSVKGANFIGSSTVEQRMTHFFAFLLWTGGRTGAVGAAAGAVALAVT